MENNTKETLDESNTLEIENNKMVEEHKDHNVINGVILLNTCVACNNKFKPIKSMIDESSCALCSNKK